MHDVAPSNSIEPPATLTRSFEKAAVPVANPLQAPLIGIGLAHPGIRMSVSENGAVSSSQMETAKIVDCN